MAGHIDRKSEVDGEWEIKCIRAYVKGFSESVLSEPVPRIVNVICSCRRLKCPAC